MVEAINGLIVMGTNGYVYKGELDDSEVESFFRLTKQAFDRVDDQL